MRAVGVPMPSRLPPSLSLGEAAADEDPAQGIFLATHCHGGADVQVAEGVKAGGASKQDLPGYISEVRTLGEDQQVPPPQKEGSVRTGSDNSWVGGWRYAIKVQVCSRTIMRKIPKCWEIRQYPSEESLGQRRNPSGN